MTKRSTLRLYMEGDGKPVRRIARRYPALASVALSNSYDAPYVQVTVEPANGHFTIGVRHFAEGRPESVILAEGNLNDYTRKGATA